jgi:hypothetical protein
MPSKERKLADGYTYVIAYPSLGLVKIGRAVYYAERVEQVRSMSPVDTQVVCAFVGLHHEMDLHRRFAHLRTKGEFFSYTPELREYLRSRPDAVTHEQALAASRYTQRRARRRQVTSKLTESQTGALEAPSTPKEELRHHD